MKNLIYFTVIFFFCFSIFYLFGAFFSVSFDISEWSEETRGFITCLGGFCSIVTGLMVLGISNDKK